MQYNLLVVLGATATGKTSLAVNLAKTFHAEIISADSRQIYRGMDLGTGKDIEEYTIDGQKIPHHLIDIADAGYKYNVYEFQRDFVEAFEDIQKRNHLPLVCGGTGMYLEACLKGYKLIAVPKDQDFRDTLMDKSIDELGDILRGYKHVHNNSDLETKKRAIRAIEIERYISSHPEIEMKHPELKPLLIGIKFDREDRRSRISQRLKERLDSGMIQEVEGLIKSGVSPEDLIYYGLEYKFLTQYVTGKLTYEEMFTQLEIAIHQFAKRQMTWFRKMERSGFEIHWLDGFMPLDEKIEKVKELWNA
ncbi:tRNA (adenosine(37)-N6)-dimethylallyltransferase MiaA [Ancylomarina euxinus]|uniref:tRNA dimethylallyltransferase n=1 Tax=Ancylomarina euxinus TaxID=2283627 RepID=A0A425Y5M4_9BACT|nr:tRNA (adenosine(37)-N6)-dimethylallyltransferase MiaA [Ancylomarina euxinus]MCZ4694400.1 tRNA (adenosine(37)-N6)-dimethylallyltransferase MiaA [Ancylomarina euxinus]MUP14270.1 tRNA (adenosine(37)-N6)-dimethylallyltransferase MiaA [Ancylomarina euxinus]RRG23589.1 tRNA (adenosine(37)-N6)-dimethylallyltransferase MiaA [Ancylomarina euxinus]